MLHSVGSLLQIAASRSRGLERILAEGVANLEKSPAMCRELITRHGLTGCFLLPFMGGAIERRSWLSKFIFGYSKRHRCWFAFGKNGILLFVAPDNYRMIHRTSLDSVRSNLMDGSLVVISILSPTKEKVRLKFGENSSAIRFCRHLRMILE